MIDLLLSRLDRVKQTGPSTWIAAAPTRQEKHPSLTIKLLDDGRILLHDFGGDSTEEILAALEMDWPALFPERTEHQARPDRRPFPAIDILRCVAADAEFLLVLAAGIRRGDPIARSDYERLAPLVGRLHEALRRATT